MSSLNNLKCQIDQLAASIHIEQDSLAKHSNYFKRIMHEHQYILLLALVPIFLVGWWEGKAIENFSQDKFKIIITSILTIILRALNTRIFFNYP